MTITLDDLRMLQQLPVDIKVAKSKLRINEAIDQFGVDGLYLSFSGGKDSTALNHLLTEVEMERFGKIVIPRVYCNTGLEYPELNQHIKEVFNSLPEGLGVMIRPDKTFKQVLSHYGYPILTKTHSIGIRKLTKQNLSEKYRNKLLYGDEKGTAGMIPKKYHHLLNADFDVSEQCCDVMKKRPFHKYEKLTGRIPITGVMAEESTVRQIRYIKDGGCNAFNIKKPQSKPIGFWREQDILKYIHMNRISIPSVYGNILEEVNSDNSTTYTLTGVKRTGCMFCMFGCHLEDKNNNRFHQMKESHPKLYNYCINGGEHDSEGRWKPSQSGLGIGHVLDSINVKY